MARQSGLKKALIWLHRWLGLVAALFLILQAVTGVSNVFRESASPVLHPGLMIVEPGPDLVPLSDVLLAVREAYPELSIIRAIFQQSDDHAYVFRLRPRAGGVLWLAMANPYTGEVLGAGPIYEFPFEAALYVHANLLSGRTGTIIIGSMGLVLLLMAVSGVYLWWPQPGGFRQAIRIGRSKPLTSFLFGLHKVPGVFVALFLIVQSVSGSMVAFRADLMPLVDVFTDVEFFPPLIPADPGDMTELPAEALVTAARTRFPDSRLRDLRFVGGDPTKVLGVTFFDDSHRRPRAVDSAWFDTASGEILYTVTAREQASGNQLLRWPLAIHNGRYLGSAGEWAVAILGLSLPFLVVTGVWLWLRRRRIRP